jgi:dihydrofolate reductase
MRKIVNSTFMTLDGDITNMADWHRDYFGDEARKTADDQLFGSDAVIMGRTTYDGMFPSWSARAGSSAYADRWNTLPKYVVSSTLTDPEWTNTTVISENVVDEIRKLKDQPGQDIIQFGFGPLTRLLLDNDLLDVIHIWLHPVLSGKATATELLHRDGTQHKLELIGTELQATGMFILSYRPVRVS